MLDRYKGQSLVNAEESFLNNKYVINTDESYFIDIHVSDSSIQR